MVGPKMQDFCPRISMLKGFLNNPNINYGSSKSAKIPWSTLIFGQKSCFLGPTIFKIPQPN
jgi:hypothetical protein